MTVRVLASSSTAMTFSCLIWVLFTWLVALIEKSSLASVAGNSASREMTNWVLRTGEAESGETPVAVLVEALRSKDA